MPFSAIYGAIANIRNKLFDRGAIGSFDLGCPAISVGNITTGGTGKTPVVEYVSQVLADQGEKVCILTRGYGRKKSRQRTIVSDGSSILEDPEITGDEPLELAQKLAGRAAVIADADRVSAAAWARENLGTTVFVLDDAFQHRKARRDLDIVVIDALNPFGGENMLPFGRLREPIKSLDRADLIILTRADLTVDSESIKNALKEYAPEILVIASSNKISSIIPIEYFHRSINAERSASVGEIVDRRALAFCALGNPENFFRQMKREGLEIVSEMKFRDHHFYSKDDVRSIEKTANDVGAEILLTTAKDAVKLKKLQFNLPCFVIENRIWFDNEKKLREMISATVKDRNQGS